MRATTTLPALVMPLLLANPTADAGSRSWQQDPPRTVEIYKYNALLSLNDEAAVQERLDSGLHLGDQRIHPYVVVIRLDPDERFVSAKVLVHDGYFCTARQKLSGRSAGRLLGSIGYHLLLREVPTDLKVGLNLLGQLVVPKNLEAERPVTDLRKRFVLRSRNVDQHEGYVTAILPLAAGPLTRLHLRKIATRREGQGERKSWARPALVPGYGTSGISHDELLTILADE